MPIQQRKKFQLLTVEFTKNEIGDFFVDLATTDGILTFVPDRVDVIRDASGKYIVTFEVDN